MSVQHADPLDEVLALVGVTAGMSTSLVAGGDWAIAFEPPPAVKFNAVARGACLLTVAGVPEPIALREGDCFLMVQSRAFTLASSPGVPPEPAGPIWAAAADGGVATAGSGDGVRVIGGRFDFGDRARELLLDALPPVLHVPGDSAAAATLRWSLLRIDAEMRDRPTGSALVVEHLALIMLIHMLRLVPAGGAGLLAGLADPVVAPALRALHAEPARAWTVAELAGVAAVSRSTLAARFRQVVGRGPLDYLTGWRIELAAGRLRRGDGTVAAIARGVGYGSESALSNAFKRVTGFSPRDYRRSVLTG
ncbi:AraC family transcriptional regulator [Actinoplanes sp. DH11]|uniref:AraC family transcriptional regulator n=1 Tax=Actinoplanes sp. DH11 TaxID=2857011 RepID=UPI001E498D9F|nr:AraC family transcriptional regulator [Actinoplanes sp. DH11]